MAERYAYYPGCSLLHSAAAYDISTRAVAGVLAMELAEIDDWNCCGASEYMSLDRNAAYALVARNLALAEKQFAPPAPANGQGPAAPPRPQLLAPCSACFLNLTKTDHYLGRYADLEQTTNEALAAGGLHYTPGSIVVRHLIDAVVNTTGLDRVRANVKRPLTGLRVAPYYGCLVVRPNIPGHTFDDPEYPSHLDHLMSALGAEVVDFPLKAHCCGGHMTQISAEVAFELIYRLIKNAADYAADLIVTLCPMCQLNLDAYQGQMNRHFNTQYHVPILYFTQVMGLAFGLPARALGLGSEIVSAEKALAKIGVEVPAPETAERGKPARRKKGDKSLPMPAASASARRKSRVAA
jgi:heterodisulfide reductase subunit B